MDPATIMTVLGMAKTGFDALKSGSEVAKNTQDLLSAPEPDIIALKKMVSDLYEEIIAGKKANLAVYDALLEMKDKAEQSERFKMEAERYALTETDMGSFVYALLPEHAGTKPVHYLCTACFEQEVKSVLQPVDFNKLGCSVCGAKFLKSDGQYSGAITASVRSSRGF